MTKLLIITLLLSGCSAKECCTGTLLAPNEWCGPNSTPICLDPAKECGKFKDCIVQPMDVNNAN